MEYKIPVKKEGYYKAMLMVLNFNLGLSELELNIIACMLNEGITTINTINREIIRKSINIDKYLINNYIIRLRDKGVFIQVDPKEMKLNQTLIESVKENKLSFEFELV